MRRDHHKLICEKERRGNYNFHDIRHMKNETLNDDWYMDDIEEDDELIVHSNQKTSMTKPYRSRWIDKEFSDNSNPIRGFVRKNVGRKWDDVFSEFCDIYDQRSVLTKHLFQHLKQYVERKLQIVDGKLGTYSKWCGFQSLESGWFDYYVDPRDGILKHNEYSVGYKTIARKRRQQEAEEKAKVCKYINETTELHLLNGIWFEIKFELFEGTRKLHRSTGSYSIYYNYTEYPWKYDILLKEAVQKPRVAIKKRTLSKKELRDYGIRETKVA